MKGVIVPASDVVHGHPMKDGYLKVQINDILITWNGYDPDKHQEGTFIQWPEKNTRKAENVEANEDMHSREGNESSVLEVSLRSTIRCSGILDKYLHNER